MPYSIHSYLTAVQSLLRHLSTQQIARLPATRPVLITIALAMTACNTASIANSTSAPQEHIVATRLTADLTGKLVMVNGCLRVNASPGDVSHLLVWPPEYTGKVSVENDTVQVVDRGRTVVWHIGDVVHLGGSGVLLIEDLDKQLREELPANCPGPYWVIGDVAGLPETAQESQAPSIIPGAEATTLNAEEALVEDAQAYAAQHGVPLDEAIRRSKLQDPAGDLDAELAAKEPETFAGLWIQHSPQFRVIVQFTRDGEETIQPYIENGPLADIVEVRTAQVSLVELQTAQTAAVRTIHDLDIPVHSGINVSENCVELYVADPAQLDAALQEANIQLADYVKVVTTVK
jgi:hypothetical protein